MKLFSLILAVISLTSFSEAHPGGLDANGGHYNRKTGEYHYHRKPAAKTAAEEKRTGSAQRARPITKLPVLPGLQRASQRYAQRCELQDLWRGKINKISAI